VLNDAQLDRHERAAIVFEQEKGMGQAVDYFTFCKKRRERWTRWFLTFTTAPKELIPLQMADLLAYEARKVAVNRAKKIEKPHSPTLERMLEGSAILVKEMTEKHLQESVSKMQAFIQAHPDGLFAARRKCGT
jgi:hypothetical protein